MNLNRRGFLASSVGAAIVGPQLPLAAAPESLMEIQRRFMATKEPEPLYIGGTTSFPVGEWVAMLVAGAISRNQARQLTGLPCSES